MPNLQNIESIESQDGENAVTEAKTKIYYKDLISHPNRSTFILILLIVLMYVFFLSSPAIFHQKAEVKYTAINKYKSITENAKVCVSSWKYSKKQEMMEVQLTYDLSYSDSADNYYYYAAVNYTDLSQGTDEMPTYIVYSQYDYVVVYIGNIPEDFNTVCLYVTTQSSVSDISGIDEDNSAYLYTNSNKVNTVKKIKEKTTNEYHIEKNNEIIKEYEEKIERNNKKIEDTEKKIEEIEEAIEKDYEIEQYQTAREQEQTESEIESLKEDMKDYKTEIENYKLKNTKYQNRIDEYEELNEKLKE